MAGKSKTNPNYMRGAGYMRENSIRNATPQSATNHRSPLGQLKAENGARNGVRVIKHGKQVKM